MNIKTLVIGLSLILGLTEALSGTVYAGTVCTPVYDPMTGQVVKMVCRPTTTWTFPGYFN